MSHVFLSMIVTLLLSGPGSLRAEDEKAKDPLAGFDLTGERKKCVHSYQIRETRVLDSQSILFRLGARDYYVNRMSRPCPSLAIERRFEYKLRGVNDLCKGEIIRVLDGSGTGAGCILGDFEHLAKKP